MARHRAQYDLGKLGTVLAIANQTNRDMLEMLKKQQERQIRIIWASLAIVLVAFLIVGIGMFCAFNSFNKLTEQIEGGIHYEAAEESSQRLSPRGNSYGFLGCGKGSKIDNSRLSSARCTFYRGQDNR